MPDIAQYTFSLKELIGILLKEANVQEGVWELSLDFTVAMGFMGPPDNAGPGVAAVVNRVGIKRVTGEPAPGGIVVDASTLHSAM